MYDYPPAPTVLGGAPSHSVATDLVRLARAASRGELDGEALARVAEAKDPRLAWFVSDLLRFSDGRRDDELVKAFTRLTGVDPARDPAFADSSWLSVTNHLIAWELPAPPGYRELKGKLFTAVEPGWKPFFADSDAEIDWRLLSWGGVFIDDRPEGDTNPCPGGCIPALDDPDLTDAAGGSWYPDDALVFGVTVGSDTVALPKNIMEVHEMVNITIGGRRLGIPYCTLCRSAQAYFTDSVPAGVPVPVLRTSGLLTRSNKVMYDLRSHSVLDTFTGKALSGPLQDAHVALAQTTVVTSTWAEWKRAHPATRIIAQDGGIGRSYPLDPLNGRDANGPIFPIGKIDPRLPVQALVLGVIAPDGTAIAFSVEQARRALAEGRVVRLGDITVTADGGGLRASQRGGGELVTHEAFWFAWSQFHPGTALWTPLNR